MNPDLVSAGIDTQAAVTRHFNTYGFYENRPFISSNLFDAAFYAKSNPDLIAAGLTTTFELMQHFQRFGIYEGRLAHPNIGGAAYIESNPDLDAYWNATGNLGGLTNKEAAGVWHFYNYGFAEGRPAVALSQPSAGETSAMDNDGNHLFSTGDYVTLSFLKQVEVASFSLSDLVLSGGRSLGEDASLMPVGALNGFATEFRVVLGRATTLTQGDTLSIAKGNIIYEGGSSSNAVETFVVPKVETIAPQVKASGNVVAQDVNDDGAYSTGDRLTLKFSEPIRTTLQLSDLTLAAGLGFGADATLAPVRPINGFASDFVVTLGRGNNIMSGDVISIQPEKIVDISGNLASSSLAFTVPVLRVVSAPTDTTAPLLSNSSPFDNAPSVALGADIILTFSETVVAGNGTIIISDGSDTRIINVTDSSQVSVTGGVVTINPTFDFLPGSMYSVQMAAGVFTDTAGNPFAGLGTPTALDFTTLIPDTTAPIISAFSVVSNSTLSVTSNESGSAQLFDGVTAIGLATPLLASGMPYSINVTQQNSVITAQLKVFDDALNVTTGTTDVILGTSAVDILYGSVGEDFMFGFDGNDLIEGGLGSDMLVGGNGADQFLFNTTVGGTSDSNVISGVDSIVDLSINDYIMVNLLEVNQFDASSSNYVVTNLWAGENLLILNTRGDGSSGDAATSTLRIGIGNYNASSAASRVSYNMIGTSGADSLTGGDMTDYLTGGAGVDQIRGGDGDDVLIVAASSDDAAGELYDGGNGMFDTLTISGTTVVDLRDDTVIHIEYLDMLTSGSAQSVTLSASQLAGFTQGVTADNSDSMTVYDMNGGAMSASSGTDTFIWGSADNGVNRISGFDRYEDQLRFDFVLNQGSDGAAVTTVNGTNDLSASSLLYTGFGTSSFAQAGKAVYVMYLNVGGFDAATASGGGANTTNGIDFAAASEANILANIEAALENTSDGGGVGIISRVNGSGVLNGAAGTDIVFLLDDGSNTAVIRYQEGGAAEADYAGELSLLGVIVGNTGGNFNPAWNANIFALFA